MPEIQTRSGRRVTSRFEDDRGAYYRMQELVDAGQLRSAFAEELLLRTFGRCTPEQRCWVHVLVHDAEQELATSRPIGVAVVAMFDHAAEGLKFPKVRLAGFTLKRLGENSRTPGDVAIVGSGAERAWYGRIDREGHVVWGRNVPPEVVAGVERFCAAPVEVARAEGIRCGSCCFCSLELTDARSLAAGYGPVCASKFGLPWGQESRGCDPQTCTSEG